MYAESEQPKSPDYYASLLSDNSVLILLFHGVIEPKPSPVRNYIRKHIEKDYFARVLLKLTSVGLPISMEQVLECCEKKIPAPKRSFAITFDDGFENNVSIALPILQDLKLPATFYVCTQFVDENFMSWIDRMEDCVERTTQAMLAFPWNTEKISFSSAAEKILVMKDIRANLKRMPEIDVNEFSANLHLQCGQTEQFQGFDQLDKKMSWDQVRTLSKTPGCIVAGHSHSHRILSFLSDEELAQDLSTSISLLSKKAGVRSHHYAYPEGQAHHYDDRAIALLQSHNIRCCPSAIDGVSQLPADPFHLKRVMVV